MLYAAQTRPDLPWHLEAITIDGHTHMSLPPEAYRQGMRWLFEIE